MTRDADQLGFGDSSLPALSQTFREICALEMEDDAVTFNLDSVQWEPILAHEEYVGLRMDLRANLGAAVVRVQVYIGIGDAVRPTEITLSTLLAIPEAIDPLRSQPRALPPSPPHLLSGEKPLKPDHHLSHTTLSII